jgi:hypothetical protein
MGTAREGTRKHLHLAQRLHICAGADPFPLRASVKEATVRARSTLCLFVLCSLVVVLPAQAADYTPPTYALQVIPGGATALSNTGWVVGMIPIGATGQAAYRWRSGPWSILPDFGTQSATVAAVNDAGVAVGSAYYPVAESPYSRGTPPVVFGGTRPEIIGAIRGTSGLATAINNNGDVVGVSYSPSGDQLFSAFLRSKGNTVELLPPPSIEAVAPLGYQFHPLAINNALQVVGWAAPPESVSQTTAAVWENGACYTLTRTGEEQAAVTDVNEAGLAVGWIGPADGETGPTYPVVWDLARHTSALPLAGDVQGTAAAVNNAGLAVGTSASGWGMLYAQGQAFRLQPLVKDAQGWTIISALDINDNGQILVRAVRPGVSTSLLLTPVMERYVPPSGGG